VGDGSGDASGSANDAARTRGASCSRGDAHALATRVALAAVRLGVAAICGLVVRYRIVAVGVAGGINVALLVAAASQTRAPNRVTARCRATFVRLSRRINGGGRSAGVFGALRGRDMHVINASFGASSD